MAFTDNFTRADNPDLGVNWTVQGGFNTFGISSNAASPNSFLADSAEVYSAGTFADDQYVLATIGVTGGSSGQGIGALLRGTTSGTGDFYWIVVGAAGANNVGVSKFVGGASTSLGTRTQTFASGDILRAEVIGQGNSTILKVYFNGTKMGADIADSSGSHVASGKAGVAYSGNIGSFPTILDWEGGDLVVGAQVPVARHALGGGRW